jgi:hypothetical protein
LTSLHLIMPLVAALSPAVRDKAIAQRPALELSAWHPAMLRNLQQWWSARLLPHSSPLAIQRVAARQQTPQLTTEHRELQMASAKMVLLYQSLR